MIDQQHSNPALQKTSSSRAMHGKLRHGGNSCKATNWRCAKAAVPFASKKRLSCCYQLFLQC
jgi:hypothetical protein